MKLFSRKTLPPIVVAPVQQPQDMNEDDRQAVRAAAQLELETSLAMRDRIITEITTSARWIQASLLLVNGGAAATVLQTDAVPLQGRAFAGASFVVGMMFSLLSAFIGVQSGQDVPRRFAENAGYWLSVTLDLLRSDEIERAWAQYGRDRVRVNRLASIPGWVSLASFVIGCVIVGAYLI